MDQSLIEYLKEKESYLKHGQINDLFDEWGDTYSGQYLLDPLYDTINFLPYLRNEVPMYFANYSNRLEKVEGLSSTILDIGSNAFANCKNLKEVILPENVENIYSYAFVNCPKLTYIQLPVSIKELDDGCFITNSSNLVIDYLGTLEDWIKIDCSREAPPFSDNYELRVNGSSTHFQIPSTISRIPAYKFVHCISPTVISIPKTCSIVSEGAFEACTSLITAHIHCSSIGEYAFAGCTKLKTIHLGTEIASIREEAFLDSAVKKITYSGTKDQFNEVVIANDAFPKGVIVSCQDGEVTL